MNKEFMMAEIGGKVTPWLGRKGAKTGGGKNEGVALEALGLKGGKNGCCCLDCCW